MSDLSGTAPENYNWTVVSNAEDFLASIKASFGEEQRKSRTDYSKSVFCDKHLGIQMRLAASHSLNEYGAYKFGDTSADVNHLDYWKCPKADCDRCYQPTMFGYYSFGGEMGSRAILNPTEQRRCGAHPETPFMYVGKVGPGRRYLCPFYKCDRQGDEVQSVAVDEEVETTKDPLAGLSKADRQRAEEMAVFNSFVGASGMILDKGSAVSGNADKKEPDIRCTISGKLHWFELGEIISEEVAAKISPNRKTMDSGFSFSQEAPFVKVVTAKATRRYETKGAPVDLILHFDLRLGSKSTVLGLVATHAALLKSLMNDGPFTRVWIYDAFTSCIVWSDTQVV
jgi:hypothetical protein